MFSEEDSKVVDEAGLDPSEKWVGGKGSKWESKTEETSMGPTCLWLKGNPGIGQNVNSAS